MGMGGGLSANIVAHWLIFQAKIYYKAACS